MFLKICQFFSRNVHLNLDFCKLYVAENPVNENASMAAIAYTHILLAIEKKKKKIPHGPLHRGYSQHAVHAGTSSRA